MDLQCPSMSIIFAFLVSVFFVVKVWKKSVARNSAPNLPPGPFKLPLIGSMHHFARGHPHHVLRDLAKIYGPVMYLQLGEVTNIILSSPETAKEVMKTQDGSFAQRTTFLATKMLTYNCRDLVFSPYGDYWRQLRKICVLELLSAKRVQSFRSIREEEVSKFVRSISASAGSVINFSGMVNSLTYSILTRAAFGKVWKGEEVFIPVVKRILKQSGGFDLGDVFPSMKFLHQISGLRCKLEKLHQEFDEILENIINEHRAKNAEVTPGDEGKDPDLVDVLLNLQKPGDLELPLMTDDIKAIILDIFIAGTESSGSTVEWAMSEMLKHPRVMEKAQAEVRYVFARKGNVDEAGLHELTYLKSVIKETFRLHPPAPILPRESRVECKVNGYNISAQSKVIVNVFAIGRDPNYWTEPERFYPERFLESSIDYKGNDFELIPFGAGRRMCPGIMFGMTNVELQLAQVLYHFDWKLPDGLKPENLDMSEFFGTFVKRKNDLCLIPIPHNPLPVY